MKNRVNFVNDIMSSLILLDGAATGKIFFVEFRKKDGSIRKMTARKGVAKGLTGKGMNFRPLKRGFMTVFDMDKGEYRLINLTNLIRFSVNGERYQVI